MSRLEKQAEDLMRLSPAEESRFDKVNEIWKTNASTTVKQNKELQEALEKAERRIKREKKQKKH